MTTSSAQTRIVLSFDTDFCPEVGVEAVCNLLQKYDMNGTFFCTGRYESLQSPNEAAIHPFITDFSSVESILAPVKELQEQIPEAIGIRNHQLTSNGILYQRLPSLGIKYESSWPMPLMQDIRPITLASGLVQYPMYYSDGTYLLFRQKCDVTELVESPGLKVLSFHPVHLFHNTSPEGYQPLIDTPQGDRYCQELINQEYGIKDMFEELLVAITKSSAEVCSFKDMLESSSA